MLRRLLYASLAVLIGGLVVLAWYVSNKGFTRKWRTFMVEEFRKAGVEVNIKRLTLDPFRGLVARDVTVLDGTDRKRALAWINEILLGANYAQAIRGQTFLDSADLRDATLWLPLDPQNPDGDKLEISKLNARFYLPPQQIYLARAEAEIYGIQIYASGRVINPQYFKPQPSGESAALDAAGEIVSEIARLRYGGAAPVATIQFSGDLAYPEQMQIDLRLTGESIRRRNYEFHSVTLDLGYRNGVVELELFHAVDGRGELRATGTYNLTTSELSAHARSTLQLEELNRAFRLFSPLGDWGFVDPPDVELKIEGHFRDEPVLRLTGHADLNRFAFRGASFNRLSTDYSWEKDRWSIRDFSCADNAGEITGDVMSLPGDFHMRLNSTLNPRALAPLLNPPMTEWLGRFDFAEPPTVHLEVRGANPEANALRGTGELTYTKMLYQGAPAVPASSTVKLDGGVLTVTPFTLAQETTAGSTTALILDFTHQQLRFEKTENSTATSQPGPTPNAPGERP